MKQIDRVDFDCIRYQNLLKNNKIVGAKSQVFFCLEDAIKEQNRRLEQSRLLRERKKTEAEKRPLQELLSPREKDVLLLLYESKLTIKQIALNFQILPERIRQIKAKALRKLKIKSANSTAILAAINSPPSSSNTPPPAQSTEDARISVVEACASSGDDRDSRSQDLI